MNKDDKILEQWFGEELGYIFYCLKPNFNANKNSKFCLWAELIEKIEKAFPEINFRMYAFGYDLLTNIEVKKNGNKRISKGNACNQRGKGLARHKKK